MLQGLTSAPHVNLASIIAGRNLLYVDIAILREIVQRFEDTFRNVIHLLSLQRSEDPFQDALGQSGSSSWLWWVPDLISQWTDVGTLALEELNDVLLVLHGRTPMMFFTTSSSK
jgi:hypothetical protein